MTTAATTDLAACPFCGETPSGTVIEGSTFRWRYVQGCCAYGPEVRHDTMADDQAAAEIESTRRAIEAWNERSPRITRALALLAAVESGDWKLAPVRPSPFMVGEGAWNLRQPDGGAATCYSAMLAAAPAAPGVEG